MLLVGGVDAQLSMASKTATEQKLNANKTRKLKMPDWEVDFFCTGFFYVLRDGLFSLYLGNVKKKVVYRKRAQLSNFFLLLRKISPMIWLRSLNGADALAP